MKCIFRILFVHLHFVVMLKTADSGGSQIIGDSESLNEDGKFKFNTLYTCFIL